jgi:excisionase family DNA binding protein
VLVLEPDPDVASHAATALHAYRRALADRGMVVPAGFDQLLVVFTRAARGRPADPLTTAVGLLTVADVGRLLRLSPRAVQRRLADGDLAGVREGARWLIDAAEVRRYATEGRRQASQPGQEAVEDASSGETKEEAA